MPFPTCAAYNNITSRNSDPSSRHLRPSMKQRRHTNACGRGHVQESHNRLDASMLVPHKLALGMALAFCRSHAGACADTALHVYRV